MKLLPDFISKRAAGAPSDGVARQEPQSRYLRDTVSGILRQWTPFLRSSEVDVQQAWTKATARAIDTIHNSGYISGAVEKALAHICGTGLNLNTEPDWKALGWTKEYAREWTKDVERRWATWASTPMECDITGRVTMHQLAKMATRSFLGTGEVVSFIPRKARNGAVSNVRMDLRESMTLSHKSEYPNIIQGVEIGSDRMPIAYHTEVELVNGEVQERRYPARTATGTTQVLHLFDGEVGQYRGITVLAPVLKVIRQFDQSQDATLAAQLLQTVFAATLKSDAGEDAASQGIQTAGAKTFAQQQLERLKWYDQAKVDLGDHGQVAYLYAGDELSFHTPGAPNDNYVAMMKLLLQEIATCMGLMYEDVTGDYTSATYSSVRMGVSSNWPLVLHRRQNITGRFYQAAFEAWLEDEIDRGTTPFPGGLRRFHKMRAYVCRAKWFGPSKPTADDLKTAKARQVETTSGLKTVGTVVSEDGKDGRDHLDELADEIEDWEARGRLHPYVLAELQALPPEAPDEPDEPPRRSAS